MKNKADREKFLREYRKWPTMQDGDTYTLLYNEVCLRFYRYKFRNDAVVIVTECETKLYNGTVMPQTRYNLIIPDSDDYNPCGVYTGHARSEFAKYNLMGQGISTITDYMTKRKDVI